MYESRCVIQFCASDLDTVDAVTLTTGPPLLNFRGVHSRPRLWGVEHSEIQITVVWPVVNTQKDKDWNRFCLGYP
jgi:hypothetical protein